MHPGNIAGIVNEIDGHIDQIQIDVAQSIADTKAAMASGPVSDEDKIDLLFSAYQIASKSAVTLNNDVALLKTIIDGLMRIHHPEYWEGM